MACFHAGTERGWGKQRRIGAPSQSSSRWTPWRPFPSHCPASSLEKLKAELEAAECELRAAFETASHQQEAALQLQSSLASDALRLSALESRVERLRCELKELKVCSTGSCCSQYQELQAALCELEAGVRNVSQRIRQTECGLRALLCEIKTQTARIEEAQQLVCRLLRLVEELRCDVRAGRPLNASVKAEIESGLRELQHLLSCIARTEASIQCELSRLCQEVKAIHCELERLEAELYSALRLFSKLRRCLLEAKELSWLDWVKAELEAAECELRAAFETASHQQEAALQLQSSLASDALRLSALESRVERLRCELKELKVCSTGSCCSQYQELQAALCELEAGVRNVSQRIRQTECGLRALLCEIKTQTARIEEAQQLVCRLLRLVEELRCDVRAGRPLNASVKAEIESGLRELQHLLSCIARTEASIQCELSRLCQEVKAIHCELERLEAELYSALRLFSKLRRCLLEAKELSWLDWVKAELEAAECELRAAFETASHQQEAALQLQSSLASDALRLSALESRVERLRCELKELKVCSTGSCCSQYQELQAALCELEAGVRNVSQRIRQTECGLRALLCEIKTQTARIEEAQQLVCRLLRLVEELRCDVRAGRPLNASVKAEIESGLRELQHLLSCIARTEASIQCELSRLCQEVKAIHCELERLEAELYSALRLFSKLRRCLLEAKELSWLDWVKAELEAAECELRAAFETASHQQEAALQLQSSLASDALRLSALESRVERLRCELKELKVCSTGSCCSQYQELQAALCELEAGVRNVSQRIRQTECGLRALLCEIKTQTARIEEAQQLVCRLLRLVEELRCDVRAGRPLNASVKAEIESGLRELQHLLSCIARTEASIQCELSRLCQEVKAIHCELERLEAELYSALRLFSKLRAACWRPS